MGGCLLRIQVGTTGFKRHPPRLDVPVPTELLPADLDVRAHHEVWVVYRPAGCPPAFTPAPLQREATEHARLARSCRRPSGRLLGLWAVPQVGENAHAPLLEVCRLGRLVPVDDVFVQALIDEDARLRLHPRPDERGQVQSTVGIEQQLVVNKLIRGLWWEALIGELVARQAARFSGLHELWTNTTSLGMSAVEIDWRTGMSLITPRLVPDDFVVGLRVYVGVQSRELLRAVHGHDELLAVYDLSIDPDRARAHGRGTV